MLLKHNYLQKTLWALAPIAWGLITYFLAFGPGRAIPITYSMRLIIAIILLTLYFFKILEFRRKNNTVSVFDINLYFPAWYWFFFSSIILLIVNSFLIPIPFKETLLSSLTFAVFAGPLLEELITRTFFVKYDMQGFEFIIFNIISATSFTLMHAGYSTPTPNISDLFLKVGHFPFAFLVNIIAFKTKRLEIPIIIHMLINFINCTLPTFILNQNNIQALITLIFTCIQILLVGGAISNQENKFQNR